MSENTQATDVVRTAEVSPDGLYRYTLHRDWRDYHRQTGRWVTFVMLNPSTADAREDDPTIRRCMSFARSMGGTGLAVVNLYAYRATKPADLWRAADPVGPRNNATLRTFLSLSEREDWPIVAAWGANARPERVAEVMAMPGAERLLCLRNTKSGAPGHPLYIPSTAQPRVYRPGKPPASSPADTTEAGR